MELRNIIEEIKKMIKLATDSETVYGNPVEKDGLTVIPVSKLSYAAGAGQGSGGAQSSFGNEDKGEGSGFGLKSSAKPVGYIKIKNGESEFEPVVDVNQLIKYSFFFGAFLLFFFMKLLRKSKKRKK